MLVGQNLVNLPVLAALRCIVFFYFSAISESKHAARRAPGKLLLDVKLLELFAGPPAVDVSCLQADEMSSSDDDELSAGGFGVSLPAGKPASTPTRGEQARASEEDFNVLDSFDLPEEALQDKVGYQFDGSFFLRRCQLFRSRWSYPDRIQTIFCFRLSAWNTSR